MPSASVEKRPNGKWLLRWRNETTVLRPDGTTRKQRQARKKTYPSRAAALKAQAQAQLAIAETGRFVPAAERPTVTMLDLALDYVAALQASDYAPATVRHKDSMINSFLAYVGDETPVSALSIDLLERYAASLPGDGRKRSTRHRKLCAVEHLWEWAADRPARFPGVGRPRKLTGRRRGAYSAPPPVVALDAPSWAEVDRMIGHLDQRVWHRRVATVQRYQGLRVSQALTLRWDDLRLEEGVLVLRAGARGAKSSATRALPLHPALAKELRGWAQEGSLVIPRPDGRPWRGDAVVEPFRRAWTLAEVDGSKWGVRLDADGQPVGRAHGRPSHAIRAAFETGLLRAGVARPIASLLTGHALDPTTAAYVPMSTPEASPLWEALVAAMAEVPVIGEAKQVSHRRGPGGGR